MKFFMLVLLLLANSIQAQTALEFPITQRLPLSQRTMAQPPVKEASNTLTSHGWKFGLLGLAALSFLIRKRL